MPLGPLENACDQTIGQFLFAALGDLIGGNGGGGYVVADTDGDGAFDQVLAEYFFPGSGTVEVPNNIKTSRGVILVRNVTGWPIKPESTCGVVTHDGINLLDLLPIGSIPVIGAIVEGCSGCLFLWCEHEFSDEETVEIPV
ncbi:MAG: hypothetical protein R2792_01575 [Saprospiraceae bacterium]